jgi:hypothetical protein
MRDNNGDSDVSSHTKNHQRESHRAHNKDKDEDKGQRRRHNYNDDNNNNNHDNSNDNNDDDSNDNNQRLKKNANQLRNDVSFNAYQHKMSHLMPIRV